MQIKLLYSLLSLVGCLNLSRILDCVNDKNGDFMHIADELTRGSARDGHLTRQEVEELFTSMHTNMTSLAQEKKQIGNTTLGIEMFVYTLQARDNLGPEAPALLITSLFHAREVATLQMHVYLYLRLIFLYHHADAQVQYLLQTSKICMIPFINQDGYDRVIELFSQNVDRPLVRKNLNPLYCDHLKNELYCVFDVKIFKWCRLEPNNYDHCKDDFGGPTPFSEKETQALKFFLDTHPTVKVGINLHCFGNLWIIPYNYYADADNKGLQRNSSAYQIYSEFQRDAKFSPHAQVGNAQKLIEYTAQGEASDWMLHDKNIITFSPELGNKLYPNDFDRNFFPDANETAHLFVDEEQALFYIVSLIAFQPRWSLINGSQVPNDVYFEGVEKNSTTHVINIQMSNKGLGEIPADDQTITLQVHHSVNIRAVRMEITGEQEHNLTLSELTDLDPDANLFLALLPNIKARDNFTFFLLLDVPPQLNTIQTRINLKRNEHEFYGHVQNVVLLKQEKTTSNLRTGYMANANWWMIGGAVALLLIAAFLFVRERRRGAAIANIDKQKLFKQNINKIFKADDD